MEGQLTRDAKKSPEVAILLALLMLAPYSYTEATRELGSSVDLSGFYDSGTLTPMSRPAHFGEKRFMTREEANEVTQNMRGLLATSNEKSDPNREAPQLGGDGNNGLGAGGVGGYNAFWVDPGSDVYEIDGKIRTSIIYDPPDGRQPKMTEKGIGKVSSNFASFAYDNDGTASWLSQAGPGPFDGPETLALAERCLLGFSAGPPSIPGLYNNFKRIIQTEDHVMILLEMVHDARVIKLNADHAPTGNRKWLGDSVGHWEGDTLVVDTINFKRSTGLYGGDENLHLSEWFSLLPDGDLLYRFTVDDPSIWTKTWSGEYVWKKTAGKVYEYGCHEGNYAMGNILRGARILESEYTGPVAARAEN